MSYTLFAFYRLMFSMCLLCPFFTAFLLHIVTQNKLVDKVEHKHTYSSKKDSVKLKCRKHASIRN